MEQFEKTRDLNRAIFYEFGETAGLSRDEIDSLFKGQGFERLVIAGGGVPRDCLSFFLEVLETVRRDDPEGRIGKDDVRVLSRQTFESRINELKQDSEGQDQENLLRAIYAIRKFCLTKKSNVFLVAESEIQKDDVLKTLLYRLLDYRIIHQVARSLSHKSIPGPSFQGFAIDMGCYASMRHLQGKFVEVDLAQPAAREQMRSAPVLDLMRLDPLSRNLLARRSGRLSPHRRVKGMIFLRRGNLAVYSAATVNTSWGATELVVTA